MLKNKILLGIPGLMDGAWEYICKQMVTPQPESGFLAYVTFAVASGNYHIPSEQLLNNNDSAYPHGFFFIVDDITIKHPEYPILCLGLKDNRGLQFRAIPSAIQGIENNLSMSNIDVESFVDFPTIDGIFRGVV